MYDEFALLENLNDKMSYELQKSLTSETYRATNLYEFAKLCQFTDQTLRDVDVKYRTRGTEETSPESTTATASNPPRSQSFEPKQRENTPSRTPQPRTSSQAPQGQINEFTCYNCQGRGHMARDCRKPRRSRYPNATPATNVREMEVVSEEGFEDENQGKE